ncbi:MAG TPA: conjugal transfer protein TraX, partial [Lachnospiraceae bacterium]|nr:conjugal transfer protein TraX [Lachnospiraceae bacterium]
WNLKWVFYIFYPAHIFLLYLIAYAIGLRNILPR